MRVERGRPASIDVTITDSAGTPTNADGAVTVTITRADGSVLAADAATTNPATGVYRYALAAQSTLNVLTLTYTGTWSGAVVTETQRVEIVGDFYLPLPAIRALPNLSDTTKFTTAELVDARTWFETTFERATGVAWVPRYARDRVAGAGRSTLLLPRYPLRIDPLTGAPAIYSVRAYTDATTYTAFTAAELADLVADDGVLRRFTGAAFTTGRANLVIEYEHGFERPQADVVEAAKVAIRDRLLTDNVGNRQFSVATEAGIVRNSTPGPDRPFGIPAVDEVVAANNHRVPAIA